MFHDRGGEIKTNNSLMLRLINYQGAVDPGPKSGQFLYTFVRHALKRLARARNEFEG